MYKVICISEFLLRVFREILFDIVDKKTNRFQLLIFFLTVKKTGGPCYNRAVFCSEEVNTEIWMIAT